LIKAKREALVLRNKESVTDLQRENVELTVKCQKYEKRIVDFKQLIIKMADKVKSAK